VSELSPGDLPVDARWSVRVIQLDHDEVLVDHDPDLICATASIGKLVLLLAIAEQLADGRLEHDQPIRRPATPVADSGLWQHLDADEVTLGDACLLVASVSDNLATNALIELIGLAAVTRAGDRLGLRSTALHDIVRDERTALDPPALSSGTARELVALCTLLHREQALSTGASRQVVRWLRLNTDLSMVASACGFDPLAHVHDDRGLRIWNKTGTNEGVRCDVGVVAGPGGSVGYAVLANWRAASSPDGTRDRVLAAMRDIGELVRAQVGAR
jgi:beta-lactamase class A